MAKQPNDNERDKALEDTFPASDPPASSGITGAGKTDKPAHAANTDAQPTGTPTSDRHEAETVHHSEDELKTTPKG